MSDLKCLLFDFNKQMQIKRNVTHPEKEPNLVIFVGGSDIYNYFYLLSNSNHNRN